VLDTESHDLEDDLEEQLTDAESSSA